MSRRGRGRGRAIDATLSGGGSVPPQVLKLFGTPVTTGYENSPYTQWAVNAVGGTAPYAYALVGTYPTGITIDSVTGIISGTPTEDGTFTALNVEVTDDATDTDQLDSNFQIAVTTELNITGTPILVGWQNEAYTGFDVDATGGVGGYTFELVGSWPDGYTIDSGTGVVSGNTTDFGSFPSLSVKVSDTASHSKQLTDFTLDIGEELDISATPVTPTVEDVAYVGFTVAGVGGLPPYVFSKQGTWPAGLDINASTGLVSGTPTTPGTYGSLTVRVTDDRASVVTSAPFSIVVSAGGPDFGDWIVGDATTLSLVSGGTRLRMTATDVGTTNPRAWQLFPAGSLTDAQYNVHIFCNADNGGGSGFLRVSTSSGIPSGDLTQAAVIFGDGNTEVNAEFSGSASEDIYIGYVQICNTNGEFGEVDFEFTVELV